MSWLALGVKERAKRQGRVEKWLARLVRAQAQQEKRQEARGKSPLCAAAGAFGQGLR